MAKRSHPMKIAHLSDLHLGERLSLMEFERIIGECREHGANHLVLTGDITDHGLALREREAREAQQILLDHGYHDHRDATVIPGNHDLLDWRGFARSNRNERSWRIFFRLFGRYLGRRCRSLRFPIVKRIGQHSIYCVNSIVPPRDRWGLRFRFSRRQRRSLAKAFRHTRDGLRIVLLHHYPYRIRMRNISSFRLNEWLEDHLWLSLRGWRRLIQSCVTNGVQYIMHGHSHSSRIVGFEGSKLLALGQGKTGLCGEFSLYDLPESGTGSRRILRATDDSIDHETRRLIIPDFVVSEWPEKP